MKHKATLLILLVVTGLGLSNSSFSRTTDNQMPIEAFATLPVITSVQVSPNGDQIGILRATSNDGDYIVEIRKTSDLQGTPITFGAEVMEITGFTWLNNEKISINFRQNIQDGNRNYWVTKVAIIDSDGKSSWRIPFPKEESANFSLLSLMPEDDEHILLIYDINDNFIPDVVKYNINNGAVRTVFRGNEKISGGFIIDTEGVVRAGTGYNSASNAIDLFVRASEESEWELAYRNLPTDRRIFDFLSFNVENPEEIYVLATQDQDTAGVYLYNIKKKTFSERLFGLESVDADGVILSNKPSSRGSLLGFSYTSKHPSRYLTDESEAALYASIEAVFPDSVITLVSRSMDDDEIVILTRADKDPGTYYLLSDKVNLQKIGERMPLLDKEKLASVRYVSYKARDGRKIPSYITLPKGKRPWPAVVIPHGGPWVRDTVIFDEWSQLLANYGYLVIQPNYRGSTGYGLDHWKAGDNQWGLSKQDDLDDAAKFLVDKGLADPNRISIFGWSYGGYAAFAAAVRENSPFICSIPGAGVSDLARSSATTFSGNRFQRVFQRDTISGLSPIEYAEKITMPMLIVHGDIDQRVPVNQSRIMVEKLRSIGNKQFEYLELEGADHFLNTLYYRHKMSFYSRLIEFLDENCNPKQDSSIKTN